jgi:predicted enzyme related to lactoylglutathione lyase
MPEFDGYPAGTPSWVDLASPDTEVSRTFYSALFDWETADQGPESGGYVIFTKGGKQVAGLGEVIPEGRSAWWTTYINVDDADAASSAAKHSGGIAVVEPMDVMDVGRMAIFSDPSGAMIAAWQPRSHAGADIANEPGAFCWNELHTRDIDGAKTFYRDVFGWGAETSEMDGMSYTEWKCGESSVAGMMKLSDDVPPEVPCFWLVYFGVDDTDLAVQKATELGGTVHTVPTDIGAGRFAVLGDPTGAAFGIINL